MVLANVVLNGEWMQNLLGPNGTFVNQMKNIMEYTYRHGLNGNADLTSDPATFNAGTRHESYHNSSTSESRFFGPLERYGQ